MAFGIVFGGGAVPFMTLLKTFTRAIRRRVASPPPPPPFARITIDWVEKDAEPTKITVRQITNLELRTARSPRGARLPDGAQSS